MTRSSGVLGDSIFRPLAKTPYELQESTSQVKSPSTMVSHYAKPIVFTDTTRCYSTGRKNWNICKHHAHFNFVPSGAKSPTANPYSRIEIAPPSSPDKPFFVLNMAPTLLFSGGRLPYDSLKFPLDTSLVNPPLPQSPHWRENGEIGTEEWIGITPHMRGKAGLFSAKGGLEGGKFGDGEAFPDITPWSVGMWMRDFRLTFPVGTDVGKKDK